MPPWKRDDRDRDGRGRDDRGRDGRGWDDRGERSGPRPPRRFDDDRPRPWDSQTWEPEPLVDEQTRKTGFSLSQIDELEVTIEKLVAGGEGLARTPEGIPIFIPRSAPGDQLKVRLTQRRSGFGRAEIEEILQPGPGRREAPCPHFERCGGCDLQHLDEAHQLRYKAEAVRENLRRLGGLETPETVRVIPGQPWAYRRRTQLHVAETDRGRQVGFFARGSNTLVPIDHCPVLVPELDAQIATVEAAVQEEHHDRVDLVAGDGDRWTSSPAIEGLPQGEITVTVGEFGYTFDARCFFQGHRGLLDRLVEEALGSFEDTEGEAYDLYAGVGLFALPLARRYQRVVAVESERDAVRYARRNARSHGLDNLTVESQAVDTWITQLPEGVSRVLVDPPRVGLATPVRDTLLERRPRHITYVSCDSATLARDLGSLKTLYQLDSLALLDLFPQTGHLEAVVQLSLRP